MSQNPEKKSTNHLAEWGKVSLSPEEKQFLRGPQSRWFDFVRALRIFRECIRGFRAFHKIGPCVTIFGSARFSQGHQYYHLAQKTAAALSKVGYTIMTGGGPGIMEAANRGAREVKGRSMGCNIQLPHEQRPNPYLDQWVQFRYFFVRKLMLVKYSSAFIAFPGGFGTMDEIFETLTLIQNEKIQEFPIVLMGKSFWQPLEDFVQKRFIQEKTISPQDLNLLFITDSPEETVQIIRGRALQGQEP